MMMTNFERIFTVVQSIESDAMNPSLSLQCEYLCRTVLRYWSINHRSKDENRPLLKISTQTIRFQMQKISSVNIELIE